MKLKTFHLNKMFELDGKVAIETAETLQPVVAQTLVDGQHGTFTRSEFIMLYGDTYVPPEKANDPTDTTFDQAAKLVEDHVNSQSRIFGSYHVATAEDGSIVLMHDMDASVLEEISTLKSSG